MTDLYRVSVIGPEINVRRVFERRREAEAWLTGARDCYSGRSARTRFSMRDEDGYQINYRERGRRLDEK